MVVATATAPHRNPGDLSREYLIPPRSTFVLGAAYPPASATATFHQPPSPDMPGVFPAVSPPDLGAAAQHADDNDDGWCIVQNPANTTFDVSPTVLDNIMGSSNGVLGVKHRSETQTAVCRSYVKMNRVYHCIPLTQELRSVALPKVDEVGGVVCAVDVNVCINGEACHLKEMTHRSLSMRDASYRSQCVISTGDVTFIMEYQRFTSLTRVSDWVASVKYSRFVFNSDHPAGFRVQLTAIAEIRVLKDHWHVHDGSTASEFVIQSLTSNVEVASQSWAECAVHSSSTTTAASTKRLVPPTVATVSYRRHNQKGPQEQFHGTDHNLTVFSSASDCEVAGASSQEADDNAAHDQVHYWVASRKFDVEIAKGSVPEAVEMTLVCRHYRPEEDAQDSQRDPSTIFDPVPDVHQHHMQLLQAQRALLGEFWETFDMTVSEDRDQCSSTSPTSPQDISATPTTATNSQPSPRTPLPTNPESSSCRLTTSLRYAAFTAFCVGAGAHHGISANALSSPGISMQLNLQHYLYHGMFYIFNAPRAAQRLMRHLVEMLPHAQDHARRMSLTKGALFPHSTISGHECGSYFLTKSPRFHINADLAYIVFLYLEGVGDIIEQQERLDLLKLLLEMGRVWLEIGEWQEHHTEFRIDEVSGPDEYGGLVDGNFYTFLAVKKQLNQTTQLVRRLLRNSGATLEDFACAREASAFFEDTATAATVAAAAGGGAGSVPLCSHCRHAAVSGGVFGAGGGGTASTMPTPQQVRAVLDDVNMSDEELLEMQRAADAIVLSRDNRTGVYFAHEHFDTLKTWPGGDLSYPLYLNYHPLVVYRHKLCEIPEVLLGMLIYPSGFEQTDIQRNLMYYEPLCTHDTPESLGVISATRFRAFGDTGKGLAPLESLAQLDLDNITYTAEEGLHLSAMTASWMAVVFGIGGMRVVDGSLHMSPSLPVGVDKVNFTVQWRGAVVRVAISSKEVSYELIRGESFRLIHQDHTRVHLHEARANVFAAQRQVVIPRTPAQQMTAHFDGVIFTMESLVENLLDINFEAWSRVLTPFFENESYMRGGEPIEPFTIAEYIQVMVYQQETGSANFSGLQKVLAARNINLDLGSVLDMELVLTRYGLANAKVEELRELLRERELRLVPGVLDLLMDLKSLGLRVALVSYTRSMYDVLHLLPHAVSELFTTMIDGTEARGKNLRGRPHTDLFLRAARKMHVPSERCIVCATQLDRGYKLTDLKAFLMLLDVEEPRSAELRLSGSGASSGGQGTAFVEAGTPLGGNHYVMRIGRGQMPRSTAELEDAILAASTRRTSNVGSPH